MSIKSDIIKAGVSANVLSLAPDSYLEGCSGGATKNFINVITLGWKLPSDIRNVSGLRSMSESIVTFTRMRNWERVRSYAKNIENWCAARVGEITIDEQRLLMEDAEPRPRTPE